jgi:DNA-binding winged helix-turn-helix (wHTH) protein/tetratricopeptide (TPR) repeat protein
MASPEIYEFDEYVLDAGERRLSKSGHVVAIAPKAHDVLVALVRRAGRLVTKRELLDLVWGDVSVEEGILSVHVSALRKALGDDGGAERTYIETVPRAGYRFSAAVTTSDVVTRQPLASPASPATGPDPFSMRWPVGVLTLPAQPAQLAVSELIGRGRTHLLTASRSEVPKALEAFHSAIALDPNYAAAHAGLALACCAQAELRLTSPDDAYTQARTAALRALAMDASNADAQVALGTVLFLSDWNWIGARRSLERALAIGPDHTEGCLLYGRLLEALGRLDEGLMAKQKALERNPSSAAVHLQIALSYWNQRRYDDMIAWATRSLELDSQHLLAREYIAGAYLKKGDLDRHMTELLAHAKAAGAPAELIEELSKVYASDGRPGVVRYALRINSRVNPDANANDTHNANNVSHAHVSPVQLALLFGEAGHLDKAFHHLDAAIARHDPALVHLAVAPQWDWLRIDSRFDQRLRRMGLC